MSLAEFNPDDILAMMYDLPKRDDDSDGRTVHDSPPSRFSQEVSSPQYDQEDYPPQPQRSVHSPHPQRSFHSSYDSSPFPHLI